MGVGNGYFNETYGYYQAKTNLTWDTYDAASSGNDWDSWVVWDSNNVTVGMPVQPQLPLVYTTDIIDYGSIAVFNVNINVDATNAPTYTIRYGNTLESAGQIDIAGTISVDADTTTVAPISARYVQVDVSVDTQFDSAGDTNDSDLIYMPYIKSINVELKAEQRQKFLKDINSATLSGTTGRRTLSSDTIAGIGSVSSIVCQVHLPDPKYVAIEYVEQDGVLNYIKNSKSVTVPKEFKARKNAPATKLAYITANEAKMLKKMKKGTPHKGPKGIPSYDSFDAQGGFTSGAAMSAAESGRNTSDTLAAGMSGRDVQDLRSSAIAAGAGQRVNPGFFDSRNVVSPAELARARALNPTAFNAVRGGGIGSFITGGGLTGALLRGLGQRLGFGKNYNEATYDMSELSGLPLGGSAAFENLDIRDKFNRNSKFRDYLDFQKLSPDAITFEEYLENIDQAPKGIMTTSSLPANNLLAFAPNSKLDRALKNLYSGYENLGIKNPQMLDLMKQDLEENKQKGTPLSLPKEAYSLIG